MFFCDASIFDCPVAAASSLQALLAVKKKKQHQTKHEDVNWSADDHFVRCLCASNCGWFFRRKVRKR